MPSSSSVTVVLKSKPYDIEMEIKVTDVPQINQSDRVCS